MTRVNACFLRHDNAYCTRQGVVHRDLKLENLLLCGSDSMQKLKIADFGYSKACLETLDPF